MTGVRPGLGSRTVRVGACLSLSGRYARFGRQAARALEVWSSLDGAAELIVEDDRSDPDVLQAAMRRIANDSDVLLGPYSTQLMRTAGKVAAELDVLLWNHGGSGDDVEAAHPGHIVSVLTPTSRYAKPFLRYLTTHAGSAPLWIAEGKGSVGRQVAAGADDTAHELGIDAHRMGPGDELPSTPSRWTLFCAGSFEQDVQTVQKALELPYPPQSICAVAAGVHEFGEAVGQVEGIFGVGQWMPGSGDTAELGPSEAEFLAAYAARTESPPDYPAVQAAAGAVLATHCVRASGQTTREALWAVARTLDTTTLFGDFKVDPSTGVQIKHEAVLMKWTSTGLSPVPRGG